MNKKYPEWPPEISDVISSDINEISIKKKKVNTKAISYEWPPEISSDICYEITIGKNNNIENYASCCGGSCINETEKINSRQIKWLNNSLDFGHCF